MSMVGWTGHACGASAAMRNSDAPPNAANIEVSRLGRLSWALFEWGRNPSFTLISLYIYAPYFARDVVGDPVRGQALWGEVSGWAGLMVALCAPFLGAIADAGGRRKPWVAFFVAIMILSSALLWYGMPMGAGFSLFAIALLIALNNFGYDASIVFHGAMLPFVARPGRVGRLSGLGYALGNISTLLLLLFVLIFFAQAENPLFGLDRISHEHERIVGPICALWLAAFCIPFLLWTPDRPPSMRPLRVVVGEGLRSLGRTVKSLRHYRNVAKYLAARMIYNDGLNMMLLFGGVYASGVFGWELEQRGVFGIVLSVFAILGGLIGGRMADTIGARRSLQITLGGVIVGGVISLGFAPDRMFFVFPYVPGTEVAALPFFRTGPELGYIGVISLVAVCVVASYANSRTLMARLAPERRMTEFFGLYALSGEATAFAAPIAVAIATTISGSQQWGMAAILVFLAIGLVGLSFVREERAEEI